MYINQKDDWDLNINISPTRTKLHALAVYLFWLKTDHNHSKYLQI